MVSTHSAQSQYITDFSPKTMEPGKSPLALLAKTCETIGLPEMPMKRSSDQRADQKPHQPSKQKSPRSTPLSKEPTLTFPGLPKPSFPMGMPPMGFPFFNPMMPYPMPFPAFPMGFNRMPCPYAMMRQPCANAACIQCPTTSTASSSSSSSTVPPQMQMTPEMMAQFPFFSMYASMMPAVSGASTPSYQALLAASAAAASTSTSTAEKEKEKEKYQCNWMDSDVSCGKTFDNEQDLTAHVKKAHTPSPASSTSSEQSGKAARSSTTTPQRFNPYSKPSTSTPTPTTMPAMNPLVLPFSLQAMYSNRLMPTIAHQ